MRREKQSRACCFISSDTPHCGCVLTVSSGRYGARFWSTWVSKQNRIGHRPFSKGSEIMMVVDYKPGKPA
jgi:hypothetical protein